LRAAAPDAYAAVVALARTVHDAPLPRPLLELVKMRASQLNGCAYCLDMHSEDALARGGTRGQVEVAQQTHRAAVVHHARDARLTTVDDQRAGIRAQMRCQPSAAASGR
jgi:AhpD family alkylhydroperoxidase